MADEGSVEYLVLFAQEHVDFRISELLSVSTMFNFKIHLQYQDHRKQNPHLVVCLPNEKCARYLLSRAVSVKSVYELWGQGNNIEDLKQCVLKYPAKKMQAFTSSSSSFKISIESFNKKLTVNQQRELIDVALILVFVVQQVKARYPSVLKMSTRIFTTSGYVWAMKTLDLMPKQLLIMVEGSDDFPCACGHVNLAAPDHVFSLLLDYGDDCNEAPNSPDRLFFGRLVGYGQRHLLKQYSLKTRWFIGNTSMDPQLSFLMANQGQVRSGSLVFDPFVGTGSVLVSCSHFGAHVMGSDIDYTLLHGRGRSSRANRKGQWRAREENFRANFTQYGLSSFFVDVVVADAGRLSLREVPLFDAIITDPPYGIREGARKLETSVHLQEESDSGDQTSSCSAVRGCRLSTILTTLLDLAARYLVLNGRLVYWLPIYRPSYAEEYIPRHPCLRLVANSEQCLSRNVSRRLITMEKIKEHTIRGPNLSVVHQKFLDSCDNFRDNYFSQQNT